MAISPQDARQRALEEFSSQIIEHEAKIDAGLVAGKRWFLLPSLPELALSELRRKFEAAGWRVISGSDPRDGGYWSFEDRRNKW